MDFLKELAVGYKSAKSYPPTHPIMAKIINSAMNQLNRLMLEFPEFSMYFLEQTIIFQDLRIDVERNFALLAMMDALKKNEINSLSFYGGVSLDDIKNLFEVISAAKLIIKEYGDATTMLTSKGTSTIKINAVKFGVQGGQATVQVTAKPAPEVTAALKTEEDFIKEIKNLKNLVDQGVSHLIIKDKLVQTSEVLSQASPEKINQYRTEVTKILEPLTTDQRVEILQDTKLNPFLINLIAALDNETMIKLIAARAANADQSELSSILKAINETKLTSVLPDLKQIIPNIYEYLAQVGLLLSEKVTTLISKDDLRLSLRSYFAMLDNTNARLREESLKSLMVLVTTFIHQKYFDIAEEVVNRITVVIDKEAIEEVVLKILEPLTNLYHAAADAGQEKIITSLLEPFSRILSRPGISIQFKKQIIKFLGETGNPMVLDTLFSFLWETGLYTDVRAAIIRFGKNAVPVALQTLKEAEDYTLRMKLVDIITNIGPPAVETLLNQLELSEWFLRRNIIAILGDIGDKNVLPRLASCLEDPDDRVRLETVRTFGKMEYETGLLKALNDVSMDVKAEALKHLRKNLPDEKIQGLLPLLAERGDELHLELIKIMADRKYTPGAEAIHKLLLNIALREDEKAQTLKEIAVTTLVKINPPDLAARLGELADSKDRAIKNLAAAALKRING